MEKIILIGAGGHSRVVAEAVILNGEYEIAGLVDPAVKPGTLIYGMRVLGDDAVLARIRNDNIDCASIAFGSTGDNSKRIKLYLYLKEHGFRLPELVHPAAIISISDVTISEGVQVMAGAVIQAGAIIGANCIINTGSVVEHDCNIGKHVHICPGAVICGGSNIGDGAFIGAGATVIQGISVGRNAVIGAGSVVLVDVPDGARVWGVVNR
ncbi:MAG: acetyltransferase [Nitrospira sp.]|nr:acetyltransferase [bacterium]MBL7048036.1 acetyltransferase [Nitrospira sp.]